MTAPIRNRPTGNLSNTRQVVEIATIRSRQRVHLTTKTSGRNETL